MLKIFRHVLDSIKKIAIKKIQYLQETWFVFVLELLLGYRANDKGKLSAAETRVWQTLLRDKFSTVWPAEEQVIIALIGLTGEGKSFIADRLAKQHKAVLLSSDRVRVALRKAGCSYKNVNVIVRRLLIHVLAQGGSVVLDSDHVTPNKRGSLNRLLKNRSLKAQYVRVLADRQDALRWIENGTYTDTIYDPDLVETSTCQTGWILKASERTRHYLWHRREDGTPRKFRFPHTEVWNREEKL
jgi:predicted kinase